MGNCWQAEKTHKHHILMEKLRKQHHNETLGEANIALVFDDTDKVKFKDKHSGTIDYGKARLVGSKNKALTVSPAWPDGLDFVIEINAMAWGDLNNTQQEALMDQWLCSCGVKFVPEREEIPPKKPGGKVKKGKVVKDKHGRIVYTNEMERDDLGRPKWTIHKPDMVAFREIIARYGIDALPADQTTMIKNFLDGQNK